MLLLGRFSVAVPQEGDRVAVGKALRLVQAAVHAGGKACRVLHIFAAGGGEALAVKTPAGGALAAHAGKSHRQIGRRVHRHRLRAAARHRQRGQSHPCFTCCKTHGIHTFGDYEHRESYSPFKIESTSS